MRKLYLLRVGLGSRRRAGWLRCRLRCRLPSCARPVLHLCRWRLQVGLLDSVKHLDIEQTALDFCRDTWNA